MKKILLFTTILFLIACSAFDDGSDPYNVSETAKNLSGIWHLSQVSRNKMDITTEMDFSSFQLELKENGEYTFDNYLPFVVRNEGTWSTDDPYHPFKLLFKENGSDSSVVVGLDFPIEDGMRILNVTFSPGCKSNSYVYKFKRDY